MTSSTLSLDKPETFEEFYEEWYPKALTLARRRGAADPEATAQDLMLVFFTSDYIDKYDPTRVDAVTFESWVNAILYRRMNSVYRSQKRRAVSTAPIEEAPEIEYIHPEVPEFKDVAKSVFQLLRSRYGLDMARLWVSVVTQVTNQSYAESGRVRQYELARHLRWSERKVSTKLTKLRSILGEDEDLQEALHGYRA